MRSKLIMSPGTEAAGSTTKYEAEVQSVDKRRGNVNVLSYNPVGQFDPWNPSQVESDKPRNSHIVYNIQFNPAPPADLLECHAYIAAIVTAEHLLLVRFSEDGGTTEVGQILAVCDQNGDDRKDKEDLYALQWVKDPLHRKDWTAIVFGGSTGIIRITDLRMQPQRTGFFRGHAAAVNELSYCEEHPAFLLSGSKDHTLKLWSITYLVCLATFGGAQGHKAEIISVDTHFSGQFFVSGSYDSCIKIWNLYGNDNKPLLDNIRVHAVTSHPMPTVISAPIFSVNDVHDRQIDCVRWILHDTKNYYIVSKGSDETVLIWMPVLPTGAKTPSIGTEWHLCHRIILNNNKYWFVKFALLHDPYYVLALGDDGGTIKLYDLYRLVSKQKHYSNTLKTKKHRASSPNKALIRTVAFSADGKLFVGGSDDGMCHLFRRALPTTRSQDT